MRRLLSVLALFLCGLLVASCSLLPFPSILFDSSDQQAYDEMELVVDALNAHDAAALEDLFSPYALETATGFDEGMEYLLSFFPNGGVTWEPGCCVNLSRQSEGGYRSVILPTSQEVSADGKFYDLFFAYFPVNDPNPAKVGIYGLGVTPLTESGGDRADVGFGYWAGGIGLFSDGEYGYPGIYIPRDEILYPPEQADARMEQIVAAVNNQDAAAIKAMFSAPALARATDFDQKLTSLLAMFPNGGLTWEADIVNTIRDDTGKVSKLLDAGYELSADGKQYIFSFDDFVLDAKNPANVGLAALAVTPSYDPFGTDRDEAFIEWTSSWIPDGDGSTGIYVPTD